MSHAHVLVLLFAPHGAFSIIFSAAMVPFTGLHYQPKMNMHVSLGSQVAVVDLRRGLQDTFFRRQRIFVGQPDNEIGSGFLCRLTQVCYSKIIIISFVMANRCFVCRFTGRLIYILFGYRKYNSLLSAERFYLL